MEKERKMIDNMVHLQQNIKQLVHYGLKKHLLEPEDEIYTINTLLDIFKLDEYKDSEIEEEKRLEVILEEMTEAAYDRPAR